MRYTLVAVLAFVLAGCDEHNEVVNPGTVSRPLGADLYPGQSIRIPQLGLTATFDSVTSDSRCPLGAACFWQGDGATRFSIIRDPGPAVTCTLHTTLTPRFIEVGGLLLELKELQPYPKIGNFINPRAYVAVLEMNRAGTR
jgi:hypothetical protein